MTGELRVRVETGSAYEAAGTVVTTLVGNIYAMTPGNPSLRDVPLPLGWDVWPTTFDVPAGRYTVEASLPSGQILTEDVEVSDGAAADLDLDLRESPYESHTLQYIVGNIEPAEVYHNRETYPVPRSLGSRSFASMAGSNSPANVSALWRDKGRPLSIAELVGLRELVPSAAAARVTELLGASVRPSPLSAFYPRLPSPIYRFNEYTVQEYPSQHYQYLTVEAMGDVYLVTVPWPWRDGYGRNAAVDVMVNLRQSPTGSPISVVVNDPGMGSGLGYLSAGSLTKAAVLFRDAERMLYEKIKNPVAAAAGAYVLIGTDASMDQQEWDRWLGNLRNWFPEVSDGAVLWGARRLHTAQEQSHVDQAREALLEGFRRGLPVFTLGLTWLIEGLSAFPEDPECAAALRQVRQLCLHVDMREPFVVLRLGST